MPYKNLKALLFISAL